MSEDINKNIDAGDDKGRRNRNCSKMAQPNGPRHRNKKEEDMRLWGILIFGIIGATATSFAVGQLRRTADWFYTQFTMSQSSYRGSTGTGGTCYSRSSFQEEARRRYSRRMQEEYEQEKERVERIRRMQRVFNWEKNKHKRGYERWREGDTSSSSSGEYEYHQRDDWYWRTDASYGYENWREPPQAPANYSLSHHYAILGLSRSRTMPYTDDEIKTAFRSKAMQYHPDQNQENKDIAEARFKEVMTSYEAIKYERKSIK